MYKSFFEPAEYNRVLFESDNFIVIPSLGSLVPGWLLAIPRHYTLNLSQLCDNELQELDSLALECELKLKKKFQCEVVRFEHGPKVTRSKVGCGVDYAHLHILPVNFDLVDGLKSRLEVHYDWIEMASFDSLSTIPPNTDYLYYRNRANQHFITYQHDIPSQLFRRVVAHELSAPESFDWKSFPQIATVEETIKSFSQQN